jgi:APA family basic amino acid/polyamine antiporter
LTRPATAPAPARGIGAATLTALLVSNMLGTGVFTSLGFQARDLRTTAALLLLWLVGGVAALCGALAYAELGAALPRSGGEYVYLARAYHPLVGFLGGWVSMTAGFAAPIALAGIAFGRYLAAVAPVAPLPAALALVGAAALLHATHLTLGRRVQVALTAANLLVVAGFVAAGLARGGQPVAVLPGPAAWREAASPAFAVSLVYVGYAYTGWNAAGYVAGEVHDPPRTVPRAAAAGVALVTLLYVLLNYTFLRLVPPAELAGVVEVGALAARRAFGPAGAAAASLCIAFLLTATVSAMMLAGSRVTQAVAEGMARAGGVAARTGGRPAGGVPRGAVLLQAALVAALLLTNSFERVMAYTGFTLTLMSLLTVAGLFVLRRREPALARPYRAWGYPVTPLVYVLLSAWTLAFVLAERPRDSLLGLATVLAGVPVWAALRGRRAAPGRGPTP